MPGSETASITANSALSYPWGIFKTQIIGDIFLISSKIELISRVSLLAQQLERGFPLKSCLLHFHPINISALFEKYVIRRAAVKKNLKFAKKSCLVKPSLKSPPPPPLIKGGQGGFGRAMVRGKIMAAGAGLPIYE